MKIRMAVLALSKLAVIAVLALLLAGVVSAQDIVIAPTALGSCMPLTVTSTREIAAGTGIAVSPDGRWLAEYFHTLQGGEVRLFEWTSAENAQGVASTADAGWSKEAKFKIPITPPELPTGIQWRIVEARFSADSKLLALRTIGALYVVNVESGEVAHTIGYDKEKQTYPGQFSFGGDTLAVAFWPPESVFAQAETGKAVEFRFVEAATGKWKRSLLLPLHSSDAWTRFAMTDDATRAAVLLRPEFWPGKARLRVYDTMTGKSEGETKVAAEDVLWSPDGKSLLVLGDKLTWLDAVTGKKQREAEGDQGASEFQRLRFSAAASIAVGHFTRFSSMKRLVRMNDQRDTMIAMWQLDSGKTLCRVALPPTSTVYLWPTARGDVISLEETYEVRPQLRLLKSARVVTYRTEKK